MISSRLHFLSPLLLIGSLSLWSSFGYADLPAVEEPPEECIQVLEFLKSVGTLEHLACQVTIFFEEPNLTLEFESAKADGSASVRRHSLIPRQCTPPNSNAEPWGAITDHRRWIRLIGASDEPVLQKIELWEPSPPGQGQQSHRVVDLCGAEIQAVTPAEPVGTSAVSEALTNPETRSALGEIAEKLMDMAADKFTEGQGQSSP